MNSTSLGMFERSCTTLPPIHMSPYMRAGQCWKSRAARATLFDPSKSSNPKKLKTYKHRAVPRGAHDYHNVMWDPHVYRGPTTRDFRDKHNTRNYSSSCVCKPSITKPRKIIHSERQEQKLGGIIRPTTTEVLGTQNQGSEFSKWWEESERFIVEIAKEIPKTDNFTIMEEKDFHPKIENQFCPLQVYSGISKSTDSCGLINRLEDVMNLTRTIVAKITEQSLLEVMEELELESLSLAMEKYKMKYVQTQNEVKRCEVREQKEQMERAKEIKKRIQECKEEQETETRISTLFFARHHFYNMLHYTVTELQSAGHLSGVGSLTVAEKLTPWLEENVKEKNQITGAAQVFMNEVISNASKGTGPPPAILPSHSASMEESVEKLTAKMMRMLPKSSSERPSRVSSFVAERLQSIRSTIQEAYSQNTTNASKQPSSMGTK